ncbi:hypothetical protein SBOR_1421 [Sclerotinia borealis F-4128]|uniref:Uncharacterized protein n=1 Tax=Sclerotinia borealis (strain F-4128) TaxID=1432307 RepID=W9CQ63_SCLBF|nr:hypothetical protein SBOR_1421 [Sclerotinia borealis F-4128]
MRRPYLSIRTLSSHVRCNPIYEETEAKKAEANKKPATGITKKRFSFPCLPFFGMDKKNEYLNIEEDYD